MELRIRFWRWLLQKVFRDRRLSIEQHRAQAKRSVSLMKSAIPRDVMIEKVEIEHLQAAWLCPMDAEPGKVVLYFHGGGYVSGAVDSHLMMCSLLAKSLKMNILLPEYRLAPENPFPAALEDALTAYRWLLAHGTDPASIVICGDSAGGGLSVAAALALRDAVETVPAAVVCISPWADLTHQGQSHISKAETEAVLTTEFLKAWALCYTDESNLANPLVSPVYARFDGFPPLLILVGSEEILLDDSRLLAEKAKAAGVDVTLKVWDGLWHVWPAVGDLLPETGQAFDEIGRFICTRVK